MKVKLKMKIKIKKKFSYFFTKKFFINFNLP